MTVRSRPRGGPTRRRPARGGEAVELVPLLEIRLEERPDGHPLSELLHRESAEAHLIACRLTERAPRRLFRWLDVTVPPERRERLLRALHRRLSAGNLAVASLGPNRFLLRLREAAPSLCVTTHRAGGICVTCPLASRTERDTWRVVLPRGDRARAFLRGLPAGNRGQLAIARLRPYRSGATLTRRQDRALRIAYDLGYFGYPRRGSLGDVARGLGAGRSATLEILRRATAKLARSRYGDELRPRGTL